MPGKPEQSLLWRALTHEHALKMPPGPKLPPEVIQKTAEKYAEAFRRLTG